MAAADPPLVKEIFIAASADKVFEFLVVPEKMLRWMGLAVDLDPRPGGIYRVTPNEREVIRGEFVEIVPNRKVSFTWGWERGGPDVPAGSTRVDIELIPENGGTRVRLVHNHLPNAVREQHAFGWNHHFGRLKVAAEGGDPGPDPCWSDVQQFPPRQTQEVLK